MEFALLPNSKIVCLKKGIISPMQIEKPLALRVYSVLCSVFIISQKVQNIKQIKKYIKKDNNRPYRTGIGGDGE